MGDESTGYGCRAGEWMQGTGRERTHRLYVMSAYETSAADFFEKLKEYNADLVLDIRRKNESQLCGFTKKLDLEYFVNKIVHAQYIHDLNFAPTQVLLDQYVKHWIGWEQYKEGYEALMEERNIVPYFMSRYGAYPSVCILGTDTKKRKSHSQILYSLLRMELNEN
ncbi:DUF488 family protein [Clostridium sp. Marseille-P2415]|uniref:DUF488 family protein n=1 Tax=Clostridium sp. Marseille-P2415 TaxID=1805471 RepID=UPI00190EBB8A|nr:DUF488 family protein [Clostridium sp. Marseille-P2415]